MTALKKLFPWAFFVFLAVGILFPNPFSNNPDVITDESYFLTSSLASIEKHTLPGWEFSPSGAYYGGIQTYADTAVMVPVLGAVVAVSHFSLTKAEVSVAVNTGELLQVLRLVNGAFALAALVFCYYFFKKRKIPKELALTLSLFLFLTISNVLVIEFLHTAKMWGFYVVFVALTSAFFLAQEYYRRHLDKEFLGRESYAAFLMWSGALTFFQSYVGALYIALLVAYALVLKHLSIRDLWDYFKKRWYLFVLLAITQISFMYRAYELSAQLAGISTRTATGAIDWFDRIVTPLVFSIESQPLIALYILGVLAVIVLAFYKRSFIADPRKRNYLIIACIHPILVYLIFYIGIGFDLLPRYAILLTLACTFSATILMSELEQKWMKAALACSMFLFIIINVHAISLYWQPSSETVLLDMIETRYDTPENVFITDHSARRMTLPTNAASLSYLDQDRADMSRYSFLQQYPGLLASEVAFKPITMTAYVDTEESADIARFATTTDAVWTISSDCSDLCSRAETAQRTCLQVHTDTCDILPQEVNTLPDFLRATELGYPYVLRRVH